MTLSNVRVGMRGACRERIVHYLNSSLFLPGHIRTLICVNYICKEEAPHCLNVPLLVLSLWDQCPLQLLSLSPLCLDFITIYSTHHSPEMEHATSVSWQTFQDPAHWHSYPSHGSLLCFPWRVHKSEIYSYPIPPPLDPPPPPSLPLGSVALKFAVPSQW